MNVWMEDDDDDVVVIVNDNELRSRCSGLDVQ